MTISKIYADIFIDGANVQGSVGYSDAAYANAREGTGTPSVQLGTGSNTSANVGQSLISGSYLCTEIFLEFDTSGLDQNARMSSSSLNIFIPAGADQSAQDFTMQARLYDYDVSISAADFVAGSQLSSKLLLATLDTSQIVSNQYNALAENGLNFVNSINRSGKTRILLCSDRQVAASDPANGVSEFVGLYIVKPLNIARNSYLLITDDSVRPPGVSESPDSTWSAWS